jgi:hypothetical protein
MVAGREDIDKGGCCRGGAAVTVDKVEMLHPAVDTNEACCS